ncbi:MAG: hypothetical protein M0R02_13940, partial [Bacteroidales bacterium]|nr:hypothetical protein [Bacteroidales bacterium]
QSRQQLIDSGRDNIVGMARIAIARDLEPTGYDIDFEKISMGFVKGLSDPRHDIKPGLLSRLKDRLRG